MTLNNRQWLLALLGLASPAGLMAQDAGHVPSHVYAFQDLKVDHAQGVDLRPIVAGKTVYGCNFSVHESVLPPGSAPHPAHHHAGEEMFLMIDGALRVTINGVSSQITSGGVAFVGSGDEHGIVNAGQTPARYFVVEFGSPPPGAARDKTGLLTSAFYDFDAMPAHPDGPLTSYGIFSGKIVQGCHIAIHESYLAPNSMPHPPHRHRHEEMVFLTENALEFSINGKPTRVDGGSVLFAGSQDEHGIRNPGTNRARYFVFALGPEED